jgi:hypothetical protein
MVTTGERTMLGRTWEWFLANRRRLAPLVVVVAVALIGSQFLNVWPYETTILYDLGADHASIIEVRLAYLVGEGEAAGASFRFDDGAPDTLRHVVELHPGRYTIAAELRGDHLSRNVSRALEVPAEGVVRVDLSEGAQRAEGIER